VYSAGSKNRNERQHLYESLKKINERPSPFEYYTAYALWTNDHILGQIILLPSYSGPPIKHDTLGGIRWIR
jgi:hypothetical protein